MTATYDRLLAADIAAARSTSELADVLAWATPEDVVSCWDADLLTVEQTEAALHLFAATATA